MIFVKDANADCEIFKSKTLSVPSVLFLNNFSNEWVREWLSPPPPRCRDGVNSPYLPVSVFLTPGGA